jgi:nitric oxide reductase subunit B
MRMPGDIDFILGGALPVLYLSYLGVRHMPTGTTTEEPEDILFTNVDFPREALVGSQEN